MITPSNFLNRFTMYRVVLYGLLIITVSALGLSGVNLLAFKPLDLLASLTIACSVCAAAHYCLSGLFRVSTSYESWLITALLLFLILRPSHDLAGLAVIALGAVLAMVSKYIITYHDHHIFNPVAIALVILSFLGSRELFWWVGSSILLPIVALVGFAVVHKTRKWRMTIMFISAALLSTIVFQHNIQILLIIKQVILSGPLIFFACIMFSEPLTSPTTNRMRYVFALIVGLLYGASYNFGPLHSGPEFALIIGNLFSFAISHPQRLRLEFLRLSAKGLNAYEFTFNTSQTLKFKPGQYLELTVPHSRVDSRGNRRFLSILSSPLEKDLRLAIRVNLDHSSSFKRALMGLAPGAMASAAAIGGDFVLPKSQQQKILLIAGGIGITPFISMIQDMIDTGTRRDIKLIYAERTQSGFSYTEILDQAATVGVSVYYLLDDINIPDYWCGLKGSITPELIKQILGDNIHEFVAYVSGAPLMVKSVKQNLKRAGLPRKQIKTDMFTGY